MGQLVVTGDGLDDALEALVPADVRGVKPFAQKYSLLLAENGGILDDLMITRWEDGLYMVVNGAVKYDDIGHLRDHLPDAITLNQMDDHALLALQGPKAAAVRSEEHTSELQSLMRISYAVFCLKKKKKKKHRQTTTK